MKNPSEEYDCLLNAMKVRQDVLTVEKLLDSPLSHFILLAANSGGYSGTTQEFIVNWVHSLFLKGKLKHPSEINLMVGDHKKFLH